MHVSMSITNTDNRIFIILFVILTHLRSSTYPATGISNYCQHLEQQQQQRNGPLPARPHDEQASSTRQLLVSQATMPQQKNQYVGMGSPDIHDIYVDPQGQPLVSQAAMPQPTSQLIEDRYVSIGSSDIHDIYVDPQRQPSGYQAQLTTRSTEEQYVSKTEIHDIYVDPEVNSLRRCKIIHTRLYVQYT